MQLSFDVEVEGFWINLKNLKQNTILLFVVIYELKLDLNSPLSFLWSIAKKISYLILYKLTTTPAVCNIVIAPFFTKLLG